MRRSAGVAHVTVFTKPDACGGNCLYCPRVPGVPKSYLPHSHVGRQGLSYSSEEQMRHWIDQMKTRGRVSDKIEVLILGGSFTALASDYAIEFLRGVYRGAASEPEEGRLDELVARHAESDDRRIIGITVESRPNLITKEVVERLFAYGVTKIELGVQSLDDEVLAFNDRGHGAGEVARATRIIKEFGMKVGYHLLLGMPGASLESDVKSAERIFEDASYQPDHLKIYVCEMFRREFMRERLVRLFDAGEWSPMSRSQRLAAFAEIIPRVPEFIRISRIGRKIAGDELERVHVRFDRSEVEKRFACRCVRCREPLPGRPTREGDIEIHARVISPEEVFIEARPAGGRTSLGLLRLRCRGRGSAVVRELHVYGLVAPRGETGPHQHKGVGRRLMAEAEKLVSGGASPAIEVASGVGVRKYYSALGYSIECSGMMRKNLGGNTPILESAAAQ